MRRHHMDAAERSSCVRQVRTEARTALADQRAARRESGQAMKRSLHESRAAIIGALRAAFGGKAAAPANTARDRTRSHAQIKTHGGVWDLQPSEASPAATRPGDPLLHNRVLRVIEQHPEGIRTIDVGNELGVDWRRVLGITSSLVDEGLVDQVEQDLYPAGKESRRW